MKRWHKSPSTPQRVLGRRGSVAIWTAMLAPVLTMSAGLGVEVTHWSAIQVELQRTADAAAAAGAMNYLQTLNAQKATTYAAHVAELNGISGSNSASWNSTTNTFSDNMVTAQYLATSPQNANDMAIKVTVQKQVPLAFAHYALANSAITVSATSWAQNTANPTSTTTTTTTYNTGLGCIMALDGSSASSLIVQNNGSKLNGKCEAVVNSNSPTAVYLNGQSQSVVVINDLLSYFGGISQQHAQFNGGYSVSNPNKLTAADPDPYASVWSSATILNSGHAGSCADIGGQPLNLNSGTLTLTAGHYCKGWSVSGNKTVLTLSGGVYTVDSQLNIQSGATVVAIQPTTIVLGNGAGSVSLNLSNAELDIAAPQTGVTAGLALTEQNNASRNGISLNFANNFLLKIQGAVYFPGQTLSLQNNGKIATFGGYYDTGGGFTARASSDGHDGCGQLIAKKIDIENTMEVGNDCGGISGIRPFGTQQSYWAQNACQGYAKDSAGCVAHAQITSTTTTTYTWSTALAE